MVWWTLPWMRTKMLSIPIMAMPCNSTMKYLQQVMQRTSAFLFLGGKAQPYSLTQDGELSYCHSIHTNGNGTVKNFSLFLQPIAGKTGETLDVTVISIYNPDFKPDMVETSGYGIYHSELPISFQLHFLTFHY